MIGSIAQHSTTRQRHKEQVLRRRNFLPILVFTVILWSLIGGLIYFVEPDSFGAIFAFFVLSFMALLLTFSLVLANTRRGFLAAVGLTIFLILRYLGIGNILNLLFLAGLIITVEVYFSRH